MSDDPAAHIAKLYEEVALLKGIVERMHRPGPVTDVDYSDATKPRVRIQIGTDADGQPVKGPWQPVASHAGARTIHAPVSVGQTMMLVSPDGNFENGLHIPFGFSQPTPSPSTDKDAHVDQIGDVTTTLTKSSHARTVKKMTITHTGDGVTFDCDGTIFAFSKSGLDVTNGALTHNKLNFGSTHVHGGIQPGNANTQVPQP